MPKQKKVVKLHKKLPQMVGSKKILEKIRNNAQLFYTNISKWFINRGIIQSIKYISLKKKLLVCMFILAIIIPSSYFFFKNPKPISSAWWDENWQFRVEVPLTNSSTAETDFQIAITLDTATLIDDSKMQADCDDIRVTDINGRILPHWVEEGSAPCDSATTKVWTKVPSIPASGQTLYLYYGNAGTNNIQSGKNVFSFFEDFNSSTLDTNIWTTTGTVSVGSGEIATRSGAIYTDNTVVSSSSGYIYEYRNKWTATSGAYSGLMISDVQGTTASNTSADALVYFMSNNTLGSLGIPGYAANGSTTGYNIVAGTLQYTATVDTYTINGFSIDGSYVRFYNNRTQTNQYAGTWNVAPYLWIGYYMGSNSGTADIKDITTDWIVVRKLNSNISVGTLGSEEKGPGPFAYWKFDDGYGATAQDSTSNNNDGTISEATWQSEDLCIDGRCLFFDGTNDSIVTASLPLSGTTYSVEAWFKTTDNTITQTIYSQRSTTDSDSIMGQLYLTSGKISFITRNDTGGNSALAQGTTTIQNNVWYHAVGIRDGANVYIYLNGNLEGTDTDAGGTITTNVSNIGLANVGATPGAYWKGFIDGVKIYTYARTANQLKTDYIIGSGPSGSTAVFGATDNNYLNNGLIGYWKMDENTSTTAYDSSGNKYEGTLTGSPTWVNGRYGSAVDLNGSSQYISLEDNSALPDPTSSFTISAWINPSSLASELSIFAGSNNFLFDVLTNGSLVLCNDNGGVCGNTASSSTGVISIDTWQHVTVTHNGFGTYSFYVNGVDVTSDSVGDYAHTGLDRSIGVWAYESDLYFNGIIDEVRIYKRALTPIEAQKLYSFSPGPISYWTFDEGSGNANDRSGNGTTLTNSNSTGYAPGKYGSAVNLINSSINYFSAADSSILSQTGNLTVEAWINPTTTTADVVYSIAGKWDGTNESYLLAQYGDEIRFYVDSEDNYETTTASNLVVGTWYYVSAVYNTSTKTVDIYINGVLQTSATTGTIPESIGDDTGSFFIGGNKTSTVGTINPQVSSSANDGTMTGTSFSVIGTLPDLGKNNGSVRETFQLFTGISGLSGATIDKSYLSLYTSAILAAPGGTMRVAAVDEQSPAAPTSAAEWNTDMAARTTAYSADWLVPDADAFTNSPTLNSVIQELTDSYNPSAFLIYVTSEPCPTTAATRSNHYDASAATAPKLYVEYHVVGTYDGKIDDVKIYNYPRTPSQIISDMNGDHPTPGSPVGSAIGYWKFDEGTLTTANDSGTGNNDLTLSAATTWTNSGIIGKAFDGGDGRRAYASTYTGLEPGANEDFTLSIWFKSDGATTAATEYLVDKGGSGIGGYQMYFNTSGQLICGIDDDSTSWPEDSATTTTDYYDTTWHHAVCTRDITADKLYLYVDGILVASDSDLSATGSLAFSYVLVFGDDNLTNGSDEFLGNFDEIKYYNQALSYDEVYAEYNFGKAAILGSTSTDETNDPTWSNINEYCPPGQGSTCVAPIAEWKTDENTGTSSIYDTSDNENTGTMNGSMTTADWIPGALGSALDFDGSDDCISTATESNFDFGTGSFTISGWFKHENVMVEFLDDLVGKFCYGGICLGSGEGGYMVYMSGGQMCFGIDDDSSSFPEDSACGGSFMDNAWHYFSAVKNGTTSISIYVDGLLVATDASTTADATLDNIYDFNIGCNDLSGTTQEWDGGIDNIRVYNYARSLEQIAWEYNKGKPIGWWKFDECTGGTLYDSSVNGNNGTWYGTGGGGQTSVGTCETSGTAWGNGASGKLNASLSFDGTDDYVDLLSPSDLDDISVKTISFWTKLDAQTGTGTGSHFLNKGDTGWFVSTDPDNSRNIFGHNFSTTAGRWSFPQFSLSVWHHVLVIYDRTSVSNNPYIYVDGVSQTVTEYSTPAGSANSDASFSLLVSKSPGYDRWVDGLIDDVRIYNYALTDNQIKTLYNEGAVHFGN